MFRLRRRARPVLTVERACAAFDRYVRENPQPLMGSFHVHDWMEDADDFLPVWGAREYFVDGNERYVRMDSYVLLIDKQSGVVRREDLVPNLRKTAAMTRVASAERA